MIGDEIALGLLWYVVFVFSTTCHEAAHALVAKWGGDLTAAQGGQVSLNPVPHVRREIFGMIICPLLTFVTSGWMMGWASAPYDPEWSRRYPHRAAKMALAGPIANFLIALAAAVAIHAGIYLHVFTAPETARFAQMVDPAAPGIWDAVGKLLSLFFSLNLLLGVFNLLPIPPLDGASAIGLLVNERRAGAWAETCQSMAAFSMMGLIIAWQFSGVIYDPVFSVALKLLYPFQHYS